MKKWIVLPALLALLSVPFMQTVADAYPSANVEFEGHGWGHGRGMGQWGALGYAVDHGWNHSQILEHFYGGTTAGSYADTNVMSVRLTKFDAAPSIVLQEKGQLSTTAAAGSYKALSVQLIGANSFRVSSGDWCDGPWAQIAVVSGPVTMWSNSYADDEEPSDHTKMLQVCEGSPSARTTRWLRGQVQTVDDNCQSACSTQGIQRTVNHLSIRSYLRGVVPRESPASWGDMGAGAGMNALRAQAVAARSYSLGENRAWYGKTCDTTACQVYMGYADSVNVFRLLEDTRTNRAIQDTSGEVRIRNSTFARTEFSSSTGGWTAGGVFPSVVDDGDDIEGNPNHLWKAPIPVSTVEAAWPQIGTLSSIQVTKRNGLGDWGGRVAEVKVIGSKSTVTTSGDGMRIALGLKSNWFKVGTPAGYWVAGSDGGIFAFGNAPFHGSAGGMALRKPIVGMAATPTKNGYWIVASDGGIFSFGDAGFFGSTGGMALNEPIVGMAVTASGNGYWMVASDGGIFSFGDAGFHGSTGGTALNKPIVGMAPTPSGGGYWLVASDGGIFSFGDAGFFGSTGGTSLNKPIVGMAPTPSGGGYWLVASDGGIFSFADAGFHGSTGGMTLAQPITSMAATPRGRGYYMVGRDGGIFTFGDAVFAGSVPGAAPGSTTAKVDMELSYKA